MLNYNFAEGALDDTIGGPANQFLPQFPPQCQILFAKSDHTMWTKTRIGPFESIGGADWHFITSTDVFKLTNQVSNMSPLYISKKFNAATDVNGHLLGYPPLHNHHSGLFLNDLSFNSQYHDGLISLNHNDNMCDTLHGGAHCYMTTFPNDAAIKVSSHVQLTALFQDIRAKNSSGISWWIEVGICVSRLPPSRHVVLWRVDPYPGLSFNLDLKNRMPRVMKPFETFPIPSGTRAVSWVEATSAITGHVISIWHHAHEAHGLEETWYIEGAADVLGLRACSIKWTALRKHTRYDDWFLSWRQNTTVLSGAAGWAIPTAWSDRSGGVTRLTMDDVSKFRQQVRTKMRHKNVRYRCIAHGSSTLASGDRQATWNCTGSDELVAGHPMTVIMFWNTNHQSEPIFQHHHFQAYVAIDTASNYFVDAYIADSRTCRATLQRDMWHPRRLDILTSFVLGACILICVGKNVIPTSTLVL